MADFYPGICLDDLSDSEDSDAGIDEDSAVSAEDKNPCHGVEPTVQDNSVDADSASGPPKGVSLEAWEKFRDLQKRREGIKLKTVAAQQRRRAKEEARRETKESQTVTVEIDTSQKAQPPHNDDHLSNRLQPCRQEDSQPSTSEVPVPVEQAGACEKWADFKPFLHVNDHLKGVDRGKSAPKTRLEKKIDTAISSGDYQTAEQLSDHLSTREFGKNIADAVDAKRYNDKRKLEEEIKAAKKKKKLNWGFEHKQRWETKGNM